MALFNISRIIASIAVCALGGWCMYITHGKTGIGWAVFALYLIWSTEFSTRSTSDDNES